jgi:hypothetical protein
MQNAVQRLAKIALVALLGLGLSQGATAAPTALVNSRESQSIEEFDTSGNWLRTFASTGPQVPVDIARNSETGDIYVATYTDTILRFDQTGNPSPISPAFTLPVSTNNPALSRFCLAVDNLGRLRNAGRTDHDQEICQPASMPP